MDFFLPTIFDKAKIQLVQLYCKFQLDHPLALEN